MSELYPSLGQVAVDWIETYLCHGPGDVQGEDIDLDSEFRRFIYRAYEVYPRGHPREGRRVFNRALLSRPKGRAKSELAGMLVCFEGLGDCRFDGWDAQGNPVGRPVQAPVVRCFATAEDQAGNTYDNVQYMLENGRVCDYYNVDTGLSRIFLPDVGGSIVSTSSAPNSKDGGKDTFDVFDETHLWTLPRLKQLHGMVTRNLLKRRIADGWVLETSTMYAVGEGSVAEETHAALKRSPLAGVLFDHKQAPDDVDITDDDELYAALQYVYGPFSEFMDLRAIIDSEFRNPTKRESEVRRYWLNQPWSLEEKFLLPDDWDGCLVEGSAIPDGRRVVLALDGSFNNDSTALVAACEIEGRTVVALVGIWEKGERDGENWRVPRIDVMETIRIACKRWQVAELTADPYGWRQTLEELGDEGIVVTEFTQSGPRMITATKRLYDLVTERKLEHCDDDVLRRHVLNAVLKLDARGARIYKQGSEYKVDACVALAMAVDRAAQTAAPEIYDLNEIVARLRKEAEASPSQ